MAVILVLERIFASGLSLELDIELLNTYICLAKLGVHPIKSWITSSEVKNHAILVVRF